MSNREKIDFFDRVAETWDRDERDRQQDILPLIHDIGLEKGSVVVEPGCGTGLVSDLILDEIGMEGTLHALDNAEKMLLKACARNWPPNANFYLADAQRLPLLNNSADTVLCFRSFPHLDNREAALVEFHRVLKNTGKLVVAHPIGREKLNHLHTELGKEVAHDFLPSDDQLRVMFGKNGFEIIEIVDREDRYLLRAVRI